MYNTKEGVEKYLTAVDKIGLWKSERKIIEFYIPKNAKILDLGCGAGRTTFNLYKIGYKNIIGLDLANNMISAANKYAREHQYNIDFITGDACSLPFENNIFDFVFFSFNGLQLIPKEKNRMQVIYEVYRVLRKGGYFIFTAHNREDKNYRCFWDEEKKKWLNNLQDKNLEIFGDMNVHENNGNGFIHYATINEIKELILQTQFKIIDYKNRDDIATEEKCVKDFSSNTVFWILRKED